MSNIKTLHVIRIQGHRLITCVVRDSETKEWSEPQCHYTIGDSIVGVVLKSTLVKLQKSLLNQDITYVDDQVRIIYSKVENKSDDDDDGYIECQIYEHGLISAVMSVGGAKLFCSLLKPLVTS